ncbi:hypothetical protein ZIOFF_070095 [Zingiber officinale]|uniref:Uncharacterized protein n=1 Tax=Zingiber officinale TaxID=94328 RepID=A0A8J5BI98_ZINOF|nr:hypothetical protein ZIOFF_070095 [Zingiber officinale]
MSERWEESIQKWYTNSHTSNLEYLDLATTEKTSNKELGHYISVIHNRVCLSSKVHLKIFKLLLEREQKLEEEVKKLRTALKTLTSLFLENKPLTKQEAQGLIAETSKQARLVEEETLRLKDNFDQKLQKDLDPPALGFIKPSDYASTIAHNAIVIRQHNLQIQLLVQIAEDLRDIKTDMKTVLESHKQGRTSAPSIPNDLITKLSNLTIGPTEKPKEPKGKILVFKDPLKILKEEKEKTKR